MKHTLSAAAVFMLIGGAAIVNPAHAAPLISIGVSETPGTPSLLGSTSAGITAGTFSTTNFVGTYTVTGSPVLQQPNLETSTIDTETSTGGTLYVYITEQGLTTPQGVSGFLSSFTANNFLGDVTSVAEYTFIDTNDGLWGGTALASDTFTAIGSGLSVNLSPFIGSSPFSETAEFVVKFGGQGSSNNTINIGVPEPESLAVLAVGLIGIGMIRRKLS